MTSAGSWSAAAAPAVPPPDEPPDRAVAPATHPPPASAARSTTPTPLLRRMAISFLLPVREDLDELAQLRFVESQGGNDQCVLIDEERLPLRPPGLGEAIAL